jgi:hypothetical protein
MVFEKIIFHSIFAAETAHVVGDRIKPRVEAKPQPWVGTTKSREPTKWAIDRK